MRGGGLSRVSRLDECGLSRLPLFDNKRTRSVGVRLLYGHPWSSWTTSQSGWRERDPAWDESHVTNAAVRSSRHKKPSDRRALRVGMRAWLCALRLGSEDRGGRRSTKTGVCHNMGFGKSVRCDACPRGRREVGRRSKRWFCGVSPLLWAQN